MSSHLDNKSFLLLKKGGEGKENKVYYSTLLPFLVSVSYPTLEVVCLRKPA